MCSLPVYQTYEGFLSSKLHMCSVFGSIETEHCTGKTSEVGQFRIDIWYKWRSVIVQTRLDFLLAIILIE